jgi:succinyl-diaminopimelate desuccinylase
MTKIPTTKDLARVIEGYRGEMIDLQRRLTAIPAIPPVMGGTGEGAKAEMLMEFLREADLGTVERFDAPDPDCPGGRPNLCLKAPGKDSSRTVWVMAHMDVVPPGDLNLWTGDPWILRPGRDAQGRETVVGRGVEDNQQGLVAGFFALKALRGLSATPAHDIGLLFVADEEAGSRWGIGWLLQEHAGLFRQDDLIIVPDAGDAQGTMIEVAEKSICWLKVTVKGKQVHASTPAMGINAHLAGSHLLVRLHKKLRTTYREKDRLFDPPVSTFEPTKKDANVPNINTIPGEDVFYYDCRVLPRFRLEEVLGTIRAEADAVQREFGVTVALEPAQQAQAAPATSADAPVVKALQRAVKAVYRRKARPMGIGGGTVAALFRNAGFDAAVWGTLDECAHQPDEYCVLENLIGDARVFAHIFAQD